MDHEVEDFDEEMSDSVKELSDAVVGHRIIGARWDKDRWGGKSLKLTLDDLREVSLSDGGGCCAYTQVEGFLLNPSSINHVITGVSTEDGYTTWHIYADMVDILRLDVAWGEGTGYYGYGFDIHVED